MSSPSKPPSFRPLRRDNNLITPAGGLERLGETFGQMGPKWRDRRRGRLSLRDNPETPARIDDPRKPLREKQKRRRCWASAFFVNRGAGWVCNRPTNSGGRIRTCDLRVMSPTSYQAALPRNLYSHRSRPGGRRQGGSGGGGIRRSGGRLRAVYGVAGTHVGLLKAAEQYKRLCLRYLIYRSRRPVGYRAPTWSGACLKTPGDFWNFLFCFA